MIVSRGLGRGDPTTIVAFGLGRRVVAPVFGVLPLGWQTKVVIDHASSFAIMALVQTLVNVEMVQSRALVENMATKHLVLDLQSYTLPVEGPPTQCVVQDVGTYAVVEPVEQSQTTNSTEPHSKIFASHTLGAVIQNQSFVTE